MDKTEIYYYFAKLLEKLDELSPLLEFAMDSEGLTKVDDLDIEELFHILYSPLDRAVVDLQDLLYENSPKFREDMSVGEEYE